MCGGAGGGGAAPQSRAAPLPAAINSRPAQHVPAAAAAAAPAGPAVPSRRLARTRSAVRGLREPRWAPGGAGRGSPGRAGLQRPPRWGGSAPPAPRDERPAGTRVGSRVSPRACLLFLSFLPDCSVLGRTRSSCLPKPCWQAGIPPCFPSHSRFPRVGRVPAVAAGAASGRSPAPGSSDRASARAARDVPAGILVHLCCRTATAVQSWLACQGGESLSGLCLTLEPWHTPLPARGAPTLGILVWSHTQVFVSQPPSSAFVCSGC